MNFNRLTSSEQIRDLISWHNKNSDFVVIDCETTSVEPREAQLVDIQISGQDSESAVIFSSDYADSLLLLDPNKVLVGHNYKYDAHVLFRHGVDLLDYTWRDTLLIGHLLDENRDSYSLDSYVKEGWNDAYKEEFWTKNKTYEEATEGEKVKYACSDIYYTEHLYRQMCASLPLEGIPETLVKHAHRLQASLLRTEIHGIRVDLQYLADIGVKVKHEIDELQPKMREAVRYEVEGLEIEAWQKKIDGYKTDKGKASAKKPTFSFESSQQLSGLLYGSLGLPVQRNDKTKSISTDYASLEKIRDDHPVVVLIQKNRELQKVYTTYIKGTNDKVENERIYPEFRVAGPVTGRISHNNPNLAQLPKEGGVRGIYVPDPGGVLLSADYCQLEVVLEAHLTGDRNLIRMLENGESKHDLTARELGCGRDTAKTLNFCLQYWGTHFKVAKLLGIPVNEAHGIWRRYWEIYSGPKALKEKTDKIVDDGIALQTVFGRKRRFGVRKRSPWDGDYRQAYNFLIQSPGADATSRAFYLADYQLRKLEYGCGLFTVHDELIIQARKEYAEYAEKVVITTMENVGKELDLVVPLKAQSSGGMLRWLDKS